MVEASGNSRWRLPSEGRCADQDRPVVAMVHADGGMGGQVPRAVTAQEGLRKAYPTAPELQIVIRRDAARQSSLGRDGAARRVTMRILRISTRKCSSDHLLRYAAIFGILIALLVLRMMLRSVNHPQVATRRTSLPATAQNMPQSITRPQDATHSPHRLDDDVWKRQTSTDAMRTTSFHTIPRNMPHFRPSTVRRAIHIYQMVLYWLVSARVRPDSVIFPLLCRHSLA